MGETTPRFALPLLEAGQAQKELFHNEALTLLEILAQPVAETIGADAPPPAPAPGKSWIVGAAPTGDWAGHAGAIACWSGGGWRFVAPVEGMCFWLLSAQLWTRRVAGAWITGGLPASALLVGGAQVVGPRQPAVATPAGGATIDGEARTAVTAILAALRTHGLIEG